MSMMINNKVYFDYAAATPVDDRVLAAMAPFWQEKFYNPSSLYDAAQAAKADLLAARQLVSKTLGARPTEVIFTAGATESINLAVLGVGRRFPGSRILTTTIEHPAVLESVDQLASEGHKVAKLPVAAS